MIILSSKADDYIGKNNKVDKKLCEWSGIVDKSNDVIEFENLKKIVGDDITYDLDSFKKMKYNETEKWQMLNLDYSRRTELIDNPEKALPNASMATAKEDKFIKYLFNQQNTEQMF